MWPAAKPPVSTAPRPVVIPAKAGTSSPPTDHPHPGEGRDDAVRAVEALWRGRGINAVPAVVVEGKYLISGGQPAAVFEEALRKISREL